MKIATIAREPEHSPNMASNDAAILAAVAARLRAKGAEVVPYDGSNLPFECDAVCHMARSCNTLEQLARLEKNGTLIINSPASVKGCSRLAMMQRLQKAGIPQPAFTIIEEHTNLEELHYPAWIKRAEGWSCHKNDICYATNAVVAKEAVAEMSTRGIDKAIHCAHIKGDIVKFYGVSKQFFHYCYPDPEKSKFGIERINGAPHRYPFSHASMKEQVFAAAAATGLEIYGGDCIVSNDGRITIIDMNDFPSFSAVREQAAREIAQYITDKINSREK